MNVLCGTHAPERDSADNSVLLLIAQMPPFGEDNESSLESSPPCLPFRIQIAHPYLS